MFLLLSYQYSYVMKLEQSSYVIHLAYEILCLIFHTYITTRNTSFYDKNPHDGVNFCHIIYHNMTQKFVAS
jgi:hypothetical protein